VGIASVVTVLFVEHQKLLRKTTVVESDFKLKHNLLIKVSGDLVFLTDGVCLPGKGI
jgi:hypothetical protein